MDVVHPLEYNNVLVFFFKTPLKMFFCKDMNIEQWFEWHI